MQNPVFISTIDSMLRELVLEFSGSNHCGSSDVFSSNMGVFAHVHPSYYGTLGRYLCRLTETFIFNSGDVKS